ncbi:MAG: sulfotransferase family protein [Actinomycetota bacterium]
MDDTERATLPNFFVIGAQKGGTTSLYWYLAQHPEVFMSPIKEPGFFALAEDAPPSPTNPEKLRNWADYRALFAGVTHETAIGEASTKYLFHRVVPEHLRTFVPDARLIAILRDPADRAFSAYSMYVALGEEARSFAQVVDDELAGRRGSWRCLEMGRYGEQLQRYYRTFPAAQIQVHLFEDLARDTPGVVRRVYDFLGVDPEFVFDVERRNVSRYDARSPGVDRVLRQIPGRAVARRLVSPAAWERARRAFRRRASRAPEFPDEVRARLVEYYRDDIAVTEALIGRDLAKWTAER